MRFIRPSKGSSIGLKWGLCSFALAGLAGCSTLPSSGPTGSQIAKIRQDPDGHPDFNIVEVSGIANLPPPAPLPLLPASGKARQSTDMIGSGDFLDIAIYEAGVSLFSGNGGSSLRAAMEPSTQVERLPVTRVDDNGYIRVPFAGQIRASGLTTTQLAVNIRRALQGMSQNPQVVVALHESIANSVLVSGEVGKPGRLALSTNQETLSDAIALAGGYKGDSKDYAVRLQRGPETSEMRLSDALSDATRDFPIFPGDKIAVIRQPLSFSVMGAPGRIEQIPFATSQVSLAEALAQSGGANPNMGDPKAVFVLRFVRDEGGKDIPTVYHLNMMETKSYFLAQRFSMRDKDVLYVGNARANQPSKLVQIISQLFSPIATVDNVLR
jgi:polysaccharide export outer membrane protein